MNQDTNSSSDSCNVVYNMQSIYCNESIVQSKSTVNINESFYVNSESDYAILEKHDVTREISQNAPKTFSFCSDVICNKITLINFPIGKYILNLNGQNVMTAKIENLPFLDIYGTEITTADYIFDFTDVKAQSSTLNTYTKATTALLNIPLKDGESKEQYLNLCRIDSKRIISSNVFDENTKYKIKLEGYINPKTFDNKDSDIYTKVVHIDQIFPFAYSIYLNHPTDCIDLTLNKKDLFKEASMQFYIDNKLYANYLFNDQSCIIRIKCKDLENMKFQKGAQNCLLSENINQNTINFSRVDRVMLVLNNCTYQSINQFRYMCYHYPSRALRYSN